MLTNNLAQNGKFLKAIFLVAGALLIVFCYFMDVAELAHSSKDNGLYYTFSGKAHAHVNGNDGYASIDDCKGDKLCNTVKSTPILAGFAIAFCVIVLVFQLCEEILSRKIKKFHIRIIQLFTLFFAWLFVLLLPILYFTTKNQFYNLCWLPLMFEFLSVGSLAVAFFFYYQGNSSKGTGLLS